MRTTIGALVLLSVSGGACVTNHIGPGVLREDWGQARRDPDPTRNPTEELTANPWATEAEERIPPVGTAPPAAPEPPARDRRLDVAKRGAATFLAWATAGRIPLLEWSGTFEEVPAARRRPTPTPPPSEAE